MTTINLELAITRANGGHTATLTAALPGGDARLAADVPLEIGFEALRGLELFPDAYGAALTAMSFPQPLREAWARAIGAGEGRGAPVRLLLILDEADDVLHALLWEALRDPLSGLPLARGEAVRLARYLPSASMADLTVPPRPSLRAVVAVAAPQAAPPVDVAGVVGAALAGLADISAELLDGQEGRPAATLPGIVAALRGGAPILFLACHGALVSGESYLWLEQAGAGPYRPTAGSAFVEALAQLEQRPLLLVLSACQGAGTSYEVLRAMGPQLARAGVAAVLAMREQIPQAMVAALLPPLFAELRRDGEIDRALAAARAALGPSEPWWLPALWMRARDGRLWREATVAPSTQTGGIHIGGSVGTVQVVNVSGGSVRDIIGSQYDYRPPPISANHSGELRQRLEMHRQTLAHYLGQVAITGSAHARPEVTAGIREARQEIRRIKATLRAMGQAAGDQLDDEGA